MQLISVHLSIQGETTDGTGSNGSAAGAATAPVAWAPGPLPTSEQLLTWEKLSPAEFQQLQDFAACKSTSKMRFSHTTDKLRATMLLFCINYLAEWRLSRSVYIQFQAGHAADSAAPLD